MKRTEVLEKINTHFACDIEGNASAEDMLKFFEEELKMTPPERFNPDYDFNKSSEYDRHPFLEYPVPKYVRTWEK